MASAQADSAPLRPPRSTPTRSVVHSQSALLLSLAAAFALRIVLFLCTSLPTRLQHRPELTTPITSWSSLLEAHFLHRHPPTSPVARYAAQLERQHVSAYHSGTIHHSPLLLPLLDTVLARHLADPSDLLAPLLWSLVDVAAGYLVFRICRVRETAALVRKSRVWPWDRSRAITVTLVYLLNPYTIAVCLSRSTATLENLCVLASVYGAMTASTLLMSISWAFASLLSLYPVLLLPILVQLCVSRAGDVEYEKEVAHFRESFQGAQSVRQARRPGFLVDRTRSAKRWAFAKTLVLCPLALLAGIFASRAIALNPGDKLPLLQAMIASLELPLDQGWEWAERVYGVVLLADDLTPNLGLWWYFFMETFDHFRDFFLLTFNMHVAAYVVPVMLKYRQDPLFGFTIMVGIIAVFKSYPTVSDHAIFFALFGLHSQIFQYLRYPLVSTLIYSYCTLLAPAFHHLWLTAGSGNANFFYAITLVWALGGGMLLLDMMWAWGRERWERERPLSRTRRPQLGKNGDAVPPRKPERAARKGSAETEQDTQTPVAAANRLDATPSKGVAAIASAASVDGHPQPRKRVVVQI
ncbi:hypothetical protein ACQY0O_000401 [Thecaphora frezii]